MSCGFGIQGMQLILHGSQLGMWYAYLFGTSNIKSQGLYNLFKMVNVSTGLSSTHRCRLELLFRFCAMWMILVLYFCGSDRSIAQDVSSWSRGLLIVLIVEFNFVPRDFSELGCSNVSDVKWVDVWFPCLAVGEGLSYVVHACQVCRPHIKIIWMVQDESHRVKGDNLKFQVNRSGPHHPIEHVNEN